MVFDGHREPKWADPHPKGPQERRADSTAKGDSLGLCSVEHNHPMDIATTFRCIQKTRSECPKNIQKLPFQSISWWRNCQWIGAFQISSVDLWALFWDKRIWKDLKPPTSQNHPMRLETLSLVNSSQIAKKTRQDVPTGSKKAIGTMISNSEISYIWRKILYPFCTLW